MEHLPAPAWLFRPLTPVELCILIILAKHPNYANNIAQSITLDLDKNTRATALGVRKALKRMQTRGWVAPYPHMDQTGRNEQPYTLTDYGHAQLDAELTRLAIIIDAGRAYSAQLSSRKPSNY